MFFIKICDILSLIIEDYFKTTIWIVNYTYIWKLDNLSYFLINGVVASSLWGYRVVVPVIYLKHDISIVSGKETIDDPCILSNTSTT